MSKSEFVIIAIIFILGAGILFLLYSSSESDSTSKILDRTELITELNQEKDYSIT